MRKIARLVERACRIAFSSCADARSRPNGFSTITRAPLRAAGALELLDDSAEQRRRDREVVRRSAARRRARGAAPRTSRRPRSRRRRSAAGGHELRERRLVDAAVLLEAVARARAELVQVPARLRDADDRHVEVPALRSSPAATGRSSCTRDRRWRRRTPAHRSARQPSSDVPARVASLAAGFSTWPPNSKRIADSSLFWNSASPRELKRS